MLDTSVAAYIAAWRRQDHATCIAIARTVVSTVRRWDLRDADQCDADEWAEEAGITTVELLRGS